jgi:hypothetical protein
MLLKRNVKGQLLIVLENNIEELALESIFMGDQTGSLMVGKTMLDMGKQLMEFET